MVKVSTSYIYVYGSVHDLDKTHGLCGTFNLDCSDDFEMRDGSDYADTDSEAGRPCEDQELEDRYSPDDFGKDWR